MSQKTPANFLGIPEEFSAYEKAAFAVIPVPYEHTVSYGGGTANGPSAIIEASAQVELYDEELRFEPYEAGVATLPALDVAGKPPREMARLVSRAVAGVLSDGKIPIVLGGEHSVTPPAVASAKETFRDITVVQFDAHADLRQEYEGEPMSHACAMARVRETCPAVQVGIRNLSAEEAAWVSREGLPLFFAHEMRRSPNWMARAIDAIGTELVYVTIDLDAFDSTAMPATGTPEPGGMSWYDVVDFLRLISKERRVVGFDVVELAPAKNLHACDFLAAKLIYKFIGYCMTGRKA
ncbi:MAG TPA: agmatinase [bacterium]|nr:agmatinase [bacterium]